MKTKLGVLSVAMVFALGGAIVLPIVTGAGPIPTVDPADCLFLDAPCETANTDVVDPTNEAICDETTNPVSGLVTECADPAPVLCGTPVTPAQCAMIEDCATPNPFCINAIPCPDGTTGPGVPTCTPDNVPDFMAGCGVPDGSGSEIFTRLNENVTCVQNNVQAYVLGLQGQAATAFCSVFTGPSATTQEDCEDAVAAGDDAFFTAIVNAIVASLLAPTVTVDVDETTVNAPATVNVSGTVQAFAGLPLPMTITLDVDSPLASEDATVPVTADEDGAWFHLVDVTTAGTYTYTATATYDAPIGTVLNVVGADSGSASNSTVVFVPLAVTLAFQSLASQLAENVVHVNGTATANRAATGTATIAIAEVTTTTGTEGAFWTSSSSATRTLAAGSNAFELNVANSDEGSVTWNVTVTVESTTFYALITVNFDDEATQIEITVSNVDATVALATLTPSSTYTPDGTNAGSVSSTATVVDNNGAGTGNGANGRINDASLTVVLARGADARSITPGAGTGVDAVTRSYGVTTSLPARLEDGAYVLNASYNNPGVDVSSLQTLTVSNVAPTVGVTAEAFAGTEHVDGSDNVAVTLDDVNFGKLDATGSTELTSLAVAIKVSDGACGGAAYAGAGLTVSFSGTPSGATASGSTLTLSAVTSAAALATTVGVAWDGAATAGTYDVCGTLTDDNAATSGVVRLATLTLSAINEGFHLTIDDGGDGLAVSGQVSPGASATTEGLRISITGTEAAAELNLTVGSFVLSTDAGVTFDAANLAGVLCPTATLCSGGSILSTATVVDGSVVFSSLGSTGGAGANLYVFFTFSVPNGTAAGSFAAPVSVSAVPA